MAKEKPWQKSDFVELRSAYNMAALDCDRIDYLLKRAEEFAYYCSKLQLKYLMDYLACLRGLYRHFAPLMPRAQKEVYKTWFETMYSIIYEKKQLTWRAYRKCEEMHNMLLDTRQRLGLGVNVYKETKKDDRYLKPEFRE